MAIHITRLNGGNITIGAGGGEVVDPEKTRFTLQDGTVDSHNIEETLDRNWMISNGYFDDGEYRWFKTITQADIGNTVTNIGDYAFWGCGTLTSVTIPNSVESIGDGAFDGCFVLTSVEIPASVTYIGTSAFHNCSGLTSITVLGKTTSQAQTLLADAEVPSGCTIHCTDGNYTVE